MQSARVVPGCSICAPGCSGLHLMTRELSTHNKASLCAALPRHPASARNVAHSSRHCHFDGVSYNPGGVVISRGCVYRRPRYRFRVLVGIPSGLLHVGKDARYICAKGISAVVVYAGCNMDNGLNIRIIIIGAKTNLCLSWLKPVNAGAYRFALLWRQIRDDIRITPEVVFKLKYVSIYQIAPGRDIL